MLKDGLKVTLGKPDRARAVKNRPVKTLGSANLVGNALKDAVTGLSRDEAMIQNHSAARDGAGHVGLDITTATIPAAAVGQSHFAGPGLHGLSTIQGGRDQRLFSF